MDAGVITGEEGLELTRQAITAQRTQQRTEQKAPGFYGEATKTARKRLDRAARLWEKALKETNEAYYQEGKRSDSRQERNMYVGKRKDGRPEYRTDFGPDVTEEEKIRQFKERIATVFNLGAVKVRTDTKRIVVNGDRFTAQKKSLWRPHKREGHHRVSGKDQCAVRYGAHS